MLIIDRTSFDLPRIEGRDLGPNGFKAYGYFE
jgi:hypothetical protein